MATRRMFSKDVIDTDMFLEMPTSSQLLYFHLALRADDDGFVASPKRILRLTGCSGDDLRILLGKEYLIPFESGVCVIRHWRIHNYIRSDRYKETIYKEEKKQLTKNERNEYKVKETVGRPDVIPSVIPNDIPNGSPGKVRLGKDSNIYNTAETSSKKKKPSPDESGSSRTPAVLNLPVLGGEEHPVTQEMIDEYQDAYPAVNVLHEIKRMRVWLKSNKKNQKTKRGITRFINNWLSRSQDRAQKVPTETSMKPRPVKSVLDEEPV